MQSREMELTRIVCGRYDANVGLDQAADPALRRKHRIWSKRARGDYSAHFIPIATDGETALHSEGKELLRDFLLSVDPQSRKRILVLTSREISLALPALVDFDGRAIAMESVIPVFTGIEFHGSLEKRLIALQKKLALLSKLRIPEQPIAARAASEGLFKIERAIRSKNGLDKFFALLQAAPYQEVFKLREERSNRAVIALDFNSMYGACMEGNFPDPRSLRYGRNKR